MGVYTVRPLFLPKCTYLCCQKGSHIQRKHKYKLDYEGIPTTSEVSKMDTSYLSVEKMLP